MPSVIVRKLNLQGEETWRYSGQVLTRTPGSVVIEARFNRPDTPFHGILLGLGDRFVETYYTDRWYNIFEMHDRDDDHIKGWYCNVSLPAEIGEVAISYVDLALDLLVYPDGNQLVLDEDEFSQLPLQAEVSLQARAALGALQAIFREKFQTPSG